MTRNRRVRSFVKQHKRLGRWRYAVTVLTAVIVFCTVYALILPAITMERATVCGYVEHAHTKECFTADGELICTITEHTHTDACCPSDKEADQTAATPDEASPAAELTTVQAEKAAPLRVVRAHRDLAKTGTGAITGSKQIEHFGGDDSYDYRLHLTVDGSTLEGSSTTTEHGESTGIVLLIDVTKDFIATTSDEQSKLEVIQNIVNNYINQFSVNQRNKISVILVKGEQSGSINSPGTVEVKKAWEGYEPITIGNQQIRYTANFKAGLVKAGEFLSTADTDKTAVVFITNSNPQWSVTDTGEPDRTVTNESEAKTATMNYLPTFFSTYPETDLYILDVEQASEVHATPQAMGEYIEEEHRGGYFTAGSSTELIDSFDEIITTIIPGDKTKNLIVTDVLSGNVEFADSRNLTATLYTGYNSSTDTWSSMATYTESDDELSVSGDTVTFSRPDEIDGSFKLEISFDIKTADEVYKDTTTYPSTGYPNIGDADTDWGSNNTSSGKAGYYSNADSGVSYTINGTDASAAFARPVVQAPSVTKDINVTKHWSGNLVPQAITLTLYTESGGTYTVLDTISLSAVQDAEGSYTYTFPSGETAKTIYLVEGSAVDTLPMYSGATAKINLGSGEADAAVITLTSDGSDVSVTVTNWPTTQMPATGGTGTTPFIMIGSALILIAGSVLIFRRKRGVA